MPSKRTLALFLALISLVPGLALAAGKGRLIGTVVDTVGGKGTFVAAQNPEFLREKKMKAVEEKLAEAVDQAQLLGVEPDQIIEMLRILYGEDD